MKTKILLFLILALTILTPSYSQNYADLQIDIQKDGTVSVDGITNYAPFKDIQNSHKFTSKEGEYWLFKLQTEEKFDEYIFKVTLPKNAQINYVKVPGDFRLEDNSGRISIIGFGENESLNIAVQYKINYIKTFFNKDITIMVLSGIIIFLSVFTIVLFFKLNDTKKRKHIQKKTNPKNKTNYDLTLLTPRQQEIMKIIESQKSTTQKELEEKMNIPKSSISRNLRTLEIKGIITKDKVGQTNYLSVKNSD